jgi:hypothetical protein
MKKNPTPPPLPPVVNGSSAVRVGGPALDVARNHALLHGLTLRATIETILVKVGARCALSRDETKPKVKQAKAARLVEKGGAK